MIPLQALSGFLMKGTGPGLGETVGFAVLAAVLLGAALASVLATRTFHAVMFLGAVLVTMGALFILLGSALVGLRRNQAVILIHAFLLSLDLWIDSVCCFSSVFVFQ